MKLSMSEKKIINLVREHGKLSRANIATLAEISLTKIAYLTEKLDKKGLIAKVKGYSSGGRKPSLLQVKDNICHSIGIEIGTENLRAVVINTNGTIIGSSKVYEVLKKRRKITTQTLKHLCSDAIKEANLSWNSIDSIGIGITGIIDENTGTCLFLSNAPDWQNLNVAQMVRDVTGINNVYLTDSVRGMALSESRYGLGNTIPNFILIDVGVGLGAGIIIDNKIITGTRGVVGEFGHMYIGGNNELCVCGNYGCLESIASGWAIIRRARKAISNGVVTSMKSYQSPDKEIYISDIINAAKNGDKLGVTLLEETANNIATGISILINLLNPEKIIIAGGLATGAGDLIMAPLISGAKSKSLQWLQKDIDIQLSELSEFSAARGAATLSLDKIFHSVMFK